MVGSPSWTLLVYSDMMHSNIVGDTENPLVWEVEYKLDCLGSIYLERLQVQWMPAHCLFLDEIEEQWAKSSGDLRQDRRHLPAPTKHIKHLDVHKGEAMSSVRH